MSLCVLVYITKMLRRAHTEQPTSIWDNRQFVVGGRHSDPYENSEMVSAGEVPYVYNLP